VVGQYTPDGGHIQTITLPVPLVTSLTFGGATMSTLNMTTARIIIAEANFAAETRTREIPTPLLVSP
jgi:sugar lactone lactonase YvrE